MCAVNAVHEKNNGDLKKFCLFSSSSKEDVIFDGFTIPQNTMVWGNFWSAHHDEAVFTDPWEFRPDRFLDEGGLILPTDHRCRQT